MRVALVHHWLITMRGGEKVLESLLKYFPLLTFSHFSIELKIYPRNLTIKG